MCKLNCLALGFRKWNRLEKGTAGLKALAKGDSIMGGRPCVRDVSGSRKIFVGVSLVFVLIFGFFAAFQLQGLGQGPCVPPPPGLTAWWPLDELPGATSVNDIAPGFNDVGTPRNPYGAPTSIGTSGAPVPVTSPPLSFPSGMVDGALYFYGPYIEVAHSPDLLFDGSFSIDAWVWTAQCGSALRSPIMEKFDWNASKGFSFYIRQDPPGTCKLFFKMNTSTFVSQGDFPAQTAVHVAVSIDYPTGVGVFYINGTPAGSFTPPAESITNAAPLRIGTVASPAALCEVALDEVQIFNRALTQPEVQAIYSAGSAGKCKTFSCPPPTAPTVVQAGTNDNFSPGPDTPAAAPTPGFVAAAGNPPLAGFDSTLENRHFLHSFTGLPGNIVAGELEIRLKPLPGNSQNDKLNLWDGSAMIDQFYLGAGNPPPTSQLLPLPWNTTNYPQGQVFVVPLSSAVMNSMNNNGALHVQVQDDTSVDYVILRLCVRRVAMVCVYKFNDVNGNSQRDAGEPLLSGWSFTVSPVPLPPHTSPVTIGADNVVCFKVLAPGTYTITEVVQPGWTPTTPTSQMVTVAPDQTVNVYFGNRKFEGEATADLGDAPDSTNRFGEKMEAYPGVVANFPTVFDPATGLPPGPKHLDPKAVAWLGEEFTLEYDADVGPDQDGINNILPLDNVADKDLADDGLVLPIVIPECGQIALKYIVSSSVPNFTMYLNVWFDFNRDGDWEDEFKCPLGSTVTGFAREWAVQNHVVTSPGMHLTPLFTVMNPEPGKPMWVRVTLSESPAPPGTGGANPDGRGPIGGYKTGETEDYLVQSQPAYKICGVKFHDINGDGIQQPGEPGLPNWTIMVFGPNGAIAAVTNENGEFCVEVPVAGSYTVSEQLPPGWTSTTPPTVQINVPYEETVLFGNRPVGKCDLAVKKSISPDPAVSGQQATITIQVANVGTDKCGGPTTVKDVLPSGLSFVSASVPWGWTYSYSLGTVTFTYPGSLAPGYTATLTITVNVTAASGTTLRNCAEVTNPNDTNPANNQHCVPINVIEPVGKCDLAITKVPRPATVSTGQQVTYTITVTNVGTASCPGPTTVTETIPAGLAFNSASGMGWSFTPGPGIIVCTYNSPIPPGGNAYVTIVFTVTAQPGTRIENCATVANANDVNATNNTACQTIQVIGPVGRCDLAITKRVTPDPVISGQQAMIAVTVTNVGNGSCSGPTIVRDVLPSGLTFVSASAPLGWIHSHVGGTVTFTYLGSLAPGASATLMIQVNVTAKPGTTLENCAEVSNANDTNPTNNRACIKIGVRATR